MTASIEFLNTDGQENLSLDSKENPYHQDMEIREIVANWIKESRKSAGLTQTQLGESVGVSKQNVSHWESHKHEPSVTQLVRIGQVCRCHLPKELSIDGQLSEESLRFALAYQLLPQEFRMQILGALTTAEIAAKSLLRQ
jgi:transcriptional regulator with XRE-family HTH domain